MKKIKTIISDYVSGWFGYCALELVIAFVAFKTLHAHYIGEGIIGYFCALMLANIFAFAGFRRKIDLIHWKRRSLGRKLTFVYEELARLERNAEFEKAFSPKYYKPKDGKG